jgi:uncharacterized lipoprotein NlpE involved in copper resistance
MKKIVFTVALLILVSFTGCNAPTTVNIGALSVGDKSEPEAAFTDFFDPVELVHFDDDYTSSAIVMDKNTGVLYVRKSAVYQWGMSPIYDSDGSVLTKEKWLAKRSKKEE